VSLSCGTVCVQGPSRIELGEYPGTHLGAGCENYGQLRDGIVLWSVRQGTALLQGRLWTMQGSELRATDRTFELEGEASASLPDGTIELCGSPVHWPSDFPTYPMSNIGSS
jgi:hypothetical protein